MKQRDAAIKADTLGATTLIYQNNDLYLPPDNHKLSNLYPKVSKEIKSKFKLNNRDVVIIGTDNSEINSQKAAWASFLTISDIN